MTIVDSKRAGCLAFIWAVLCLTLSCGIALAENAERLGTIASVDIKAERMIDVGYVLSRELQIPVCIEESRLAGMRGADSYQQQGELNAAVSYSLVATNLPIEAILDQFVQAYPDYEWEYDRTNHIANVFPKESAPAGWRVKDVEIAAQTVEEVLFRHDVLGLREHGIAFNPGRGNWDWLRAAGVTVNCTDIPLRRVLNGICVDLGEPRYWVINEIERPSVLRDGTGREVRYELMFRRYRKGASGSGPR